MSERQHDYLAVAVSTFPMVALVVGAAAWLAGLYLVTAATIPAAITSSFGCLPLFRDIWMHGIHNDR